MLKAEIQFPFVDVLGSTFSNPNPSFKTLTYLLNHAQKLNIDINSQGMNGRTLLHYSIYYGCPVATEFLLSYEDIDVNIPDATGKTPVHWAFVDDALQLEDRSMPLFYF